MCGRTARGQHFGSRTRDHPLSWSEGRPDYGTLPETDGKLNYPKNSGQRAAGAATIAEATEGESNPRSYSGSSSFTKRSSASLRHPKEPEPTEVGRAPARGGVPVGDCPRWAAVFLISAVFKRFSCRFYFEVCIKKGNERRATFDEGNRTLTAEAALPGTREVSHAYATLLFGLAAGGSALLPGRSAFKRLQINLLDFGEHRAAVIQRTQHVENFVGPAGDEGHAHFGAHRQRHAAVPG